MKKTVEWTKEGDDGSDKGEVSGRLKELPRYMDDTKSYPVEVVKQWLGLVRA